MTGQQPQPVLGRVALEPPQGGERYLGSAAHEAAGADLTVDVLLQVGGVEGEQVAGPGAGAHGEALVTGGVSGAHKPAHAGDELFVAVHEDPVDLRIVEVDPEHAVLFGEGMVAQPVLELAALNVHRYAGRQQSQATGVVVVQVGEVDREKVARSHPVSAELGQQRLIDILG